MDGWSWIRNGMRGSTRRACFGTALAIAGCGGGEVTASGDDSGGTTGQTTDASSTASPDTSDGSQPTSDTDGHADDTTAGLPDVDPTVDVAHVATGGLFSCDIADDGTLRCWGDNQCGQLGDGTLTSKAPVVVAPGRTWASVALGLDHGCAIDRDAKLACWGNGLHGKLGDGVLREPIPVSQACVPTPQDVAPDASWARVALGLDHGCGVQLDGTLWCWGSNEYGQIGDGALGEAYSRLVPTQVGGDAWIDVVAGRQHSCALRSDATVWCWGAGEGLGGVDLQFASSPIQVELPTSVRALGHGSPADHTCALDEGGAVWCWGPNETGALGDGDSMGLPLEIDFGAGVEELAVGFQNTCARRGDGTVHCLGSGVTGALGDGVAQPGHIATTPVQIPVAGTITSFAIAGHACARTDDGDTRCWGRNRSGQIGDGTSGPDNDRLSPTLVGPWGGGPIATGWTSVDVGGSTACGVRDGQPWCWGSRRIGALGNADDIECSLADPTECSLTTPVAVSSTGTFTQISVGELFACSIRDDGSLWCWGSNDSGQLGNPEAASNVPVQVEDATDWTKIVVGGAASCGLRSPGTLWCWGDDDRGQLGDGTPGGFATAPAAVGVETDWIDVDIGGGGHVCGLRSGGVLACWGDNRYGQLAQGAASDEPVATPSVVAGTWSSVALGLFHTCAIADDGTAWCWGRAEDGALGPVDGASAPLPVQIGSDDDWVSLALGDSFSCGLRSDGTAWCWGENHYGELGNGEIAAPEGEPVADPTMVVDIDDWLELSATQTTACGVRTDGTAMCWGMNAWGQQGNDTVFDAGLPREVRDDG